MTGGDRSERRLRGVLWDLDGTLMDTEPLWVRAKAEVARGLGIDWSDEDASWSEGRPTRAYSQRMADRSGRRSADEVGVMISTAVARLLAADPVVRPGAGDLLQALRVEGCRSALVTMANRVVAEAAQDALGVRFDVIVAGEEVVESKPHPEPYLRALDLLGLDAAECVAVEDSERGASSAEAAGLAVICVPSTPGAIAARPDRRFFAALREVTAETMSEVLAERTR